MVAEKWTIWDHFFRWLSRWFIRRKIYEEEIQECEALRSEILELEADINKRQRQTIHHRAVTKWLAGELKRSVYPDLSTRQLIEVAIKKVEDG